MHSRVKRALVTSAVLNTGAPTPFPVVATKAARRAAQRHLTDADLARAANRYGHLDPTGNRGLFTGKDPS